MSTVKITRNCLAAGLCPDPLGAIDSAPQASSWISGVGPMEGRGNGKVEKWERGGQERGKRVREKEGDVLQPKQKSSCATANVI